MILAADRTLPGTEATCSLCPAPAAGSVNGVAVCVDCDPRGWVGTRYLIHTLERQARRGGVVRLSPALAQLIADRLRGMP
jgi:hypothetical protein